MKWKKNFKVIVLLLLLIMTFIAIFDNLQISDSAEKLKDENTTLTEKVATLEKEFEDQSKSLEKLELEKTDLLGNLSILAEEVKVMKTTVPYQDFIDAKSTVESYNSTKSFKEVRQFIALANGVGASTLDAEGHCPCSLSFNRSSSSVKWEPNSVLELREFRVEKGRIFLTYNMVDSIGHDYQFDMTKAQGWFDQSVKWRIEEIKPL